MEKYKSDVVIVGGGLAGIATALELLDAGKSVTLLDRSTEDRFGGLAKESFGGVFIVDSPNQKKNGIKDSIELAWSDWCSFAEFDENDELPKKWARKLIENSERDIFYWLKERSVGFFPVVHWVERGVYRPGNSVPRFHMIWGTGQELIIQLVKRLYAHPKREKLQIYFSHKVEDFISQNGQVVGVRGDNFEAIGSSVVMACGGYGGNLEHIKNSWPTYLGSAPDKMLNGSHEFADGMLHDKVKGVGGNLTHMEKMWNYAAGVHHPRPFRDNHGLSLVPPKSALWMDHRGKRIGPRPLITSFDTSDLVTNICKTEKKYSWQILNQKIALKELAVSGSEFNKAIREKNFFGFIKSILFGNKELVEDLTSNCEDFVVAGSIEELASKMTTKNFGEKIDPEFLKSEIKKYDDQIDRGLKYHNDDQLRRIAMARNYRGDKVRTCKFQKILDPKAMPLIAIREFIVSRKSLGGMQTDLESKVLSSDGTVIKGLYAVGEAAGFGGGGMHGKRALEGTFLAGCILTAQSAAKSIRSNV
jgi:predicted oxidoreductase